MLTIWLLFVSLTTINVIYENFNKKLVILKSSNFEVIPLISVFIMIIISGLRSSVGDTGYYMYTYNNLQMNLDNIFNTRDFGFTLYQLLLKRFFQHPQWLLIISSLITISILLYILKKRTKQFSLTLFLFFTTGMYLNSMNGLRQYLASAIVLIAFQFKLNKKSNYYIIFILLSSLIHKSALIMLPFYFIDEGTINKRWFKITIIGLVFIALTFNSFFGYFEKILSSTQYSHYTETFGSESYQGEGANIVRFIESLIPIYLIIRNRYNVKKNFENFNIYFLLSVVNAVIMLFSQYNWLFARISIYFEVFNIIIISNILSELYKTKDKLHIKLLILMFYVLYFYFANLPHIYASYFLNINKNKIGLLTNSFY